ncbi:MAG TPA: VIT1/CCC1 transporter family protein [Terriglobales bacterium]|jgi:VIT1/CCC1 family predicted Fe2+/Mn2+ transporter|nr:VIT1/CCC1 transporter family protein [Terriglobales bacterium]
MAHTHAETHFTATNFVRDMVIGMSDGLTVPFALAAGLSGAVQSTRLIVIGGLAEIAAGSIAMGLGGYLAARGDAEHYEQEQAREYREIEQIPEEEKAEVSRVFQNYGLTVAEASPVVEALSKHPKAWVDFMMRFELGLEEPDPDRAVTSAATIAGAYVAGGLIPLSPYIVLRDAHQGLLLSALVTLLALGLFGFLKGRFTGTGPLRGALQTMAIGGLAAGAAFTLAKLIA